MQQEMNMGNWAVLVLIPNLVLSQMNYPRCLHKGCEMSSGLYKEEINVTIDLLLNDDEIEFKDNILRIATWNLHLDLKEREEGILNKRTDKLCNYITQLQPTIMGLQEVPVNDVSILKSCLNGYIVVTGEPSHVHGIVMYNLIVIKHSRRLTLVETGSFMLGHESNNVESQVNNSIASICTWARIRIAERKTRYPKHYEKRSIQHESFGSLLLKMLKLFTKKKEGSKEEIIRQQNIKDLKGIMKRQRKVMYSWTNFYVAVTKLNHHNKHTANKQAHLLARNLRNKVMDRRRYPVFVMGDLGFEDDSKMYEYLCQVQDLKDSMAEARYQYPSLTCDNEGLVDYIWHDKFESIMAATMTDTENSEVKISNHRPVFAAFVTK